MLGFIAGRAGTGKTYSVLRKAVGEAGNYDMTYIIVPEQSTLSYEKQIIEYNAGKKRPSVEVLSFTRIVEKVMLVTGGLAGNYIDGAGRTALVYRAIKNCGDCLRVFGKYADKPKFALSLAETIDELMVNNVSPEALMRASENTGKRILRDKAYDTAVIAEEYERLIRDGYFDPRDRLAALDSILDECRFFEGTSVYFDGFIGYSPQEERIIEHIILQSKDCVFTLTAPSDGFSDFEMFDPVASAAKRFRDFALDRGITVRAPEIFTENRKFESKTMLELEEALSSELPKKYGSGEDITVYAGADPYDEARFVAAEIRRLIIDRGYRYRDIAVISGDLQGYRSAVEAEFEQYEIPFFIDSRADVRFKPLIRLVLFALKSATHGMYYEDMADTAKTGLAGLDTEQAALLENYINLWKISGARWGAEFELNPRGFTEEKTDADIALLAVINEARERLAAPVISLKKKLADADTADAFVTALCEYLIDAGTDETIRARMNAAAESGEECDNGRMWEMMIDVFDRISSAMEGQKMTAEDFSEMAQLMFSSADIGVIPPHTDEVTVGSEGRVRVEHIRHCFILGATEDRFPSRPRTGGVFTNDDREELLSLSVGLMRDEDTRRREMSLSVYNTLTIPSEGLCLTYSTGGSETEQLRPSEVVERICDEFDAVRRISFGELPADFFCSTRAAAMDMGAGIFEEPKDNREASLRAAMKRVGGIAERMDEYKRMRENADRPLEPDAAALLAGKTTRVSPTKLDTYNRCAFRFFCRYGLSLNAEPTTEITSTAAGTFMHYLLEKTVAAVVGKSSDIELKKIISAETDAYIENCLGGARTLPVSLVKAIYRVADLVAMLVMNIDAELEKSGYVPVDFEVSISQGGDIEPWRIAVGADSGMSLIGKIDRVDLCEKDGKAYIRVIDYKTGHTKKKLALSRIYEGFDIQMLVYLIAIWLNGEKRYGNGIQPAGLYYFPARRPTINEVDDHDKFKAKLEQEIRMEGLALDEAPDAGERNTSVWPYTIGEMELLKKHIECLLKEMHRMVASGCIPKQPADMGSYTLCEKCDYRVICGVDPKRVKAKRGSGISDKEVFDRLREEYGNE